ncbi:MAG: 1-deoxy-D-xylulose-5-phosphate synthase [Gammaproteobacteria bacterium]
MKKQIMYIEKKTDGLRGEGRIGLVGTSKTGKTLYYDGRTLEKTKVPLKVNYYDTDSPDDYWISKPKKDGSDALFSSVVEIDADVREEYWTKIRKAPDQIADTTYKSPGKSKAEREKIEKGLRRRQMDAGW